MARPKKIGMDYFSHDCTASIDEKLEQFEMRYPNGLGYAWYFKALERIYRNGGELVSSAETPQILCKNLNCDNIEILKYALEIELFDSERYEVDGVLTSDSIKKRVSPVYEKRLKMAEKYEKRVSDSETTPETPISASKVKESKVKESKVKESKGKESIKKEHSALRADSRFSVFVSAFDKLWKEKREGSAGYSGPELSHLKSFLANNPEATEIQWCMACENCLLDDFHSKNFSVSYVSRKFSILLNLKKAASNGNNRGRFVGEFEHNAADKYKGL